MSGRGPHTGAQRGAGWRRDGDSVAGGWLLWVPQSECTGLHVSGGTATRQRGEDLPGRFCTHASCSVRNSGETCGKIMKKTKMPNVGCFFPFSFPFLPLVVLIVLWWF